jgi:RsiW-degrading membrane proteinase PrsW (M82 family)
MKTSSQTSEDVQMKKAKIAFLLVLLSALLVVSLSSTNAQSNPPTSEELQLVEKYTPVLYFHPDEAFMPQSVDVLVHNSRLRQDVPFWFDVNILNEVTLPDLLTFYHSDYFLDVWYGSKGASDYKNYSAHRDYYLENLSPDAGGPPITTYAHVVRDQVNQKISIQYWLFYFYNDWFNKHEGDWEFVQVILDQNENPEWVVLSQHHGGTRRSWDATQIEDGTHPVAYVALGSHANYFWGDEIYPNGQDVGDSRIEILDRTGSAQRVIPDVRLLPERETLLNEAGEYQLLEWLVFSGNWGELAFQGDFGGPKGPADKGDQWEQAYQWGINQPLDSEEWYHNRLRVEVFGEDSDQTTITLLKNQQPLENAEQGGNPAILHHDPETSANLTVLIENLPAAPFEILVTWPVPEEEIIEYTFNIPRGFSEDSLLVTFLQDNSPVLDTPSGETLSPSNTVTSPATWDAPDLVWFAGYLPANQVVLGVLLALAAGILPSLAYAALLYWNDRYEKEPIRLIAAALLWGAIPAVLVSLVAQLFFQLPTDLSGPLAVEALQAGVLTPLIEEILKGSIVVIIAFRFRSEFDNVLDGIIYGAMVGFGYALTGSTISYLGAFLLRGFSGLGASFILEGLFFGLNHAMYTAIFGAGLGYARLSQNRTGKILVPVAAFLLAVIANASHNLVINNLLGLNPLSLAVHWLGVGLIVLVSIWSLRRQRQVIATELAGAIPAYLYKNMLSANLKRISLKEAQKRGGSKEKRRLKQHYQLLAEYAFKKMQHRNFPQDNLGEELEALREEISKYQ